GNGYESYCQAMSRNFRRTLKRQSQRVSEAGEPAVDGVRLNSGIDRLESSIERLYAITEASYKLKGQRLRDDHRGYLGDVARNFAALGMLHLSTLSIGGRHAAVVMGLVERGCYYDVTRLRGGIRCAFARRVATKTYKSTCWIRTLFASSTCGWAPQQPSLRSLWRNAVTGPPSMERPPATLSALNGSKVPAFTGVCSGITTTVSLARDPSFRSA